MNHNEKQSASDICHCLYPLKGKVRNTDFNNINGLMEETCYKTVTLHISKKLIHRIHKTIHTEYVTLPFGREALFSWRWGDFCFSWDVTILAGWSSWSPLARHKYIFEIISLNYDYKLILWIIFCPNRCLSKSRLCSTTMPSCGRK